MPPGKKKKKRRSLTSHPKYFRNILGEIYFANHLELSRNSTISTARPGCQELVQNDVAQAALASVLLIQAKESLTRFSMIIYINLFKMTHPGIFKVD